VGEVWPALHPALIWVDLEVGPLSFLTDGPPLVMITNQSAAVGS
jgi:hypothetical protein